MAEIIDTSSTRREEFIGGVTWTPGILDHLIPEYSSAIAHKLEEHFKVRVEQQPKVGSDRRTNFYITRLYEVGIPEGPKQAWEEALQSISGIQSNFFEPNGPVSTD